LHTFPAPAGYVEGKSVRRAGIFIQGEAAAHGRTTVKLWSVPN
jgi:hypothetical protein